MTKTYVIALILAFVAVGVVFFFGVERPGRTLTDGEQQMLELVREVHGDNIKSEAFEFTVAGAILKIQLDETSSIPEMTINLTELARKHRDGLALPVIKASLQFE